MQYKNQKGKVSEKFLEKKTRASRTKIKEFTVDIIIDL